MIGSIIGDIVGSVYEFQNVRTTKFSFIDDNKSFTDDSILTVATADWLLHGGNIAVYYLKYGLDYPNPVGGYGTQFLSWLNMSSASTIAPSYNSCGNGSAMRVGPVGWSSDDLTTVLLKAKETADCTHNHPEGVKGAQSVAAAIYFARQGMPKQNILDEIQYRFGYDLSASIEYLQKNYADTRANLTTCQHSVPQAIVCALKSESFENAIRNAVSIGGDSDTIACICGSIAEPLFGVPAVFRDQAYELLTYQLTVIIDEFEKKFGSRII